MSPIRAFSLEQATRTLPEVERIILRLREVRTAALDLKERLDLLWQQLEPGNRGLDEIANLQQRLDSETHELTTLVERLEKIGCILRDVDIGLVDFPAVAHGIPIFLCWRVGEEGIQFWHGRDEGYAGRKPLWKMPGSRPHYA